MKMKRVAQSLILITGIAYLILALTLFFTPEWVYENLGKFPPYNYHYTRDVGAFMLPYGIGLVIASRDVLRHRLIIWGGILAGVMHMINHGYDAIVHGVTTLPGMIDFILLSLLLIGLVVVVIVGREE